MILGLYSTLMRWLQPLVRRKLLHRARNEPGYSVAVPERWGSYTQPPVQRGALIVWVHAVSLGETRACAALVDQLRLLLPGMRLLLTHGTATGRAQGESLLRPGDVQVWQPWDALDPVRRFLQHFKPTIGLLVETEVWPNLVAQCQAQNIPLCLVNARLSEKSWRQAQRLAWLSRPAYQGLRAVWAQAPADAERLKALGAPVRGVLGNFKFDAVPDDTQMVLGRAWHLTLGRPVIALVVSREGEEANFLALLKQKQLLPGAKYDDPATSLIASAVQWMIVPRHPQRFDDVAALCVAQGFTVLRRSQWSAHGPIGQTPGSIWLGDSLGEMALYYGLSDVALLGGSFEPLGGQNLIEAAACQCPVVMGPHTFNFAEAAQLAVAAGAAWQVADMQAALDKALQLVHQPAQQRTAAQAAGALAQAHQGAARRTAQAVQAVLAGL